MKYLVLSLFILQGINAFSSDVHRKGIFGAFFTDKGTDISLNGNGLIYGKVVHNGGTGVDSALIIVIGLDSVYTNDTGYFEMIVPPGTYDIVSKRDYYLDQKADSIIVEANHKYEGMFSQAQIEAAYFKPAIYMYNDEPLSVTISLDFPGSLEFTYPNSSGEWNVDILSNGKLYCQNKVLDYIYWDGKFAPPVQYDDLKHGSIVQAKDIIVFLESSLSKMGLNEKETQDFISYWGPKLTMNEASFIHFATDTYDAKVPLSITPKPDHMLRVFMTYISADQIDYLPTPQQFSPIKRAGFTVVEWGGGPLNPILFEEL